MDQNQSPNQRRILSPSPTRSMSPTSQNQIPMNSSPKTQMNQAKSNIEKATKPLFNILRKMMDDLGKQISQASQNDQVISISDLQNQSLTEYQRQYENFCYQLMKFTLEYSFTDNEIKIPLNGNFKDGIKNKLLVYLHHIKQHIQLKKKSSLKVLMNKLFSAEQNKMGYDFADSDDEGFFDGQSEKESIMTESQIQLIKISNKQSSMNFDDDFENSGPLKKKLSEALQKIKDLEFKLKNREETVQVLTTGYVKDIQHMKEMLFRQANLEDLEFYEVQYFDSSSIIDEKTRLILNDKLKDLKIQFDKKTQDLIKKIIVLSNEVERLKKLANVGGGSGDQGIVEAVKKIFVLEESPYKIWKVIQDIKGNQFFFNVFEQQRPEYGINYKEVNKMLMNKKVYEKEYNEYKAQIDDQMCNLISKTSLGMSEIQQELQEKDRIIEELNQQLTSKIEEDKQQYVQHMQDILTQKEIEQYDKHEKQKQDYISQYEQEELEKDRLRSVWLRWACVNRLIKASKVDNTEQLKSEIRKILFNNSYQIEAEQRVQKDIESLKAENKNLQTQIDQFNLEKIVISQDSQTYTDRIKQLQGKLQQQAAYIATLKNENFELNTKKSILDIALKQVYNKIGMKLTDQQFEDLDLDNEKKLSTKEFIKKIKGVDKKQFRAIRESQTAQEKIVETKNAMFQQELIKNQEVQTTTYGVNTKFEDFIKQVEQDLEDLGNEEDIEKLKSQNSEQKEENQNEQKDDENEEIQGDKDGKNIETADQQTQTELLQQEIQEYLLKIDELKEENYNLREEIEKFSNENKEISLQIEDVKNQRDQAEKKLRDTLGQEGFRNNQQNANKQQTGSSNQQLSQGYSANNESVHQQRGSVVNQSNQSSAFNTPRKSLQNSHTKINYKKDQETQGNTHRNAIKEEGSQSQGIKNNNPSNKKISKASNSKIVNGGESYTNSSRDAINSNSNSNSGAVAHTSMVSHQHSQSINQRQSISKGDQSGIMNQSMLNKNGASNSNNIIRNENGDIISVTKQDIQGDITAQRRLSNPDYLSQQQNAYQPANEDRSDEDDYFEDQPDYTNRDNSDEKPAAGKLNEKTLKRELVNNNTRKRNKKRVFERLFQDSKDKQDRMDELKRQLQKLETFHWEEVLSILNLYSKQLHEEYRQSPEDYIRLEHNKSPRDSQLNQMNQSLLQNNDMKRLNIRQNYPDIQAYTQNNKFPCINPSPIQGGRAEYYFKRQKDSSYYNIKNTTQNNQQFIQNPQINEKIQEGDFNATFTELNQENYERRKQYLEQVFESFRKHTNRMQSSNRKDQNSDMKVALNESLTSSRKKSLSHARPKTRDVSNFEDNLYSSNVNPNYNHVQHQYNTQADQPLLQSNLYDEPYNQYHYNHKSEDPLKKIDQQIKKLKPLSQQYKSQNNNQQHITPQDSARLQNNILKDKYTLQKVRQEINSANTSLNPKNRQTSGGENNVFLPESILNLVKKSKQQQNTQNNQNQQQQFDFHHY
ncbi:hypothetical protein ABPG74_003572 [Tetrahymena malaccensis]